MPKLPHGKTPHSGKLPHTAKPTKTAMVKSRSIGQPKTGVQETGGVSRGSGQKTEVKHYVKSSHTVMKVTRNSHVKHGKYNSHPAKGTYK
jgi:hypothetical protein